MSIASELLNNYAFERDYPFGIPCGQDPVWSSRSGKVRLSQMTAPHIINCMKIVGKDDQWYWVFKKELQSRGINNEI